jgi:hypothetical protein
MRFLSARPLTGAALSYAADLHGGQEREADRAPFILHPLEVAALLDAHGFGDAVTAAAVLHDTLEETDATGADIESRFGARVAQLVAALTEPEFAPPGRTRKEILREQVAEAALEAVAIFAADKVSKLHELRIRLSCDPGFGEDPAAERKLDHYWKSLSIVEERLEAHPLVGQLRFELEALSALPPREARLPVR